MNQRIWLLYMGDFGQSGYLDSVYRYKKDAVKYIKDSGNYAYNQRDGLYEDCAREEWARIDREYVHGKDAK